MNSSPPLGALFTPSNDPQGNTADDWQNFSVAAAIRGTQLLGIPFPSWAIRMVIASGTAVVGNMAILRTLPYSSAVIDRTTVTIGGTTTPVLGPYTTNSDGTDFTVIDTDPIPLAIDQEHDYWFGIAFTADVRNATVQIPFASVGESPYQLWSGFYNGDVTLRSSIAPYTTGAAFSESGYLVIGGIVAAPPGFLTLTFKGQKVYGSH